MKTRLFNYFANERKVGFVITTMVLLVLGSCTSGSLSENKYLGKIPAKASQIEEEIYNLTEKQNQVKDPEEFRKIGEKIKELNSEWSTWIKDNEESAKIEPTIPFEVEGDFPYTVKEVGLSRERSVVKLHFKLSMNRDFKGKNYLRDKITLYFTGLDSNNEIILFSALPARMYEVREDLPVGSEIIIDGTWNRDHFVFLGELAKIKIITQELYRELVNEKNRLIRGIN